MVFDPEAVARGIADLVLPDRLSGGGGAGHDIGPRQSLFEQLGRGPYGSDTA
jgi:hypothetical protein